MRVIITGQAGHFDVIAYNDNDEKVILTAAEVGANAVYEAIQAKVPDAVREAQEAAAEAKAQAREAQAQVEEVQILAQQAEERATEAERQANAHEAFLKKEYTEYSATSAVPGGYMWHKEWDCLVKINEKYEPEKAYPIPGAAANPEDVRPEDLISKK